MKLGERFSIGAVVRIATGSQLFRNHHMGLGPRRLDLNIPVKHAHILLSLDCLVLNSDNLGHDTVSAIA